MNLRAIFVSRNGNILNTKGEEVVKHRVNIERNDKIKETRIFLHPSTIISWFVPAVKNKIKLKENGRFG